MTLSDITGIYSAVKPITCHYRCRFRKTPRHSQGRYSEIPVCLGFKKLLGFKLRSVVNGLRLRNGRLVYPRCPVWTPGRVSVESSCTGEYQLMNPTVDGCPQNGLRPLNVDPVELIVTENSDMRRVQCGCVDYRISTLERFDQEPIVVDLTQMCGHRRHRTIDPDHHMILAERKVNCPSDPAAGPGDCHSHGCVVYCLSKVLQVVQFRFGSILPENSFETIQYPILPLSGKQRYFGLVNIIGTALMLLITLLVVPVISYFFGTALGPAELHALRTVLWIMGSAWMATFVAGELTGNVSQVDKLWSLLPIAYAWTVTAHGDFSARLLLMALLVTAWGMRLTWNFSRHGAYRLKFWSGHEDYRWQVLRQKPEFQPAWKWTLFNLSFISGYQNILIMLMTLPILVALQCKTSPMGLLDYFAAALMLSMILMEAIADNQQWRYQCAKKSFIHSGRPLAGDYAKGFLDQGLWKYSRHPNYFAEQGVWIAFYLFSVSASGQWINWSASGCLLLVVLFRSSSAFSEEISAAKYPEYSHYQQTVPKFIPINLFRS